MPIAAHLPEIEPGLLLAWLATYLLHSTLLLGAAWGASRLLRGRALGVEEALWKAALVGGLLTAAVQTGVAGYGAPTAGEPTATASAPGMPALAAIPAAEADALTELAGVPPGARAAADPRLTTLAAVLPGWQRLLLAGWLLGAAFLTTGLALSWLRLRARLRGRREVTGGPVRHLLDRLLHQAGPAAGRRGEATGGRRVRLTGSAALPVPVALGVGEREICLPRRVLTELGERRQRGLLAHELAHLERRDPAWLLVARAIECLLFLQPLNRLARARLQEISELRCDEWAVAATGDRVGLARCLAEVAGWLAAAGEGRAVLPVPGMARTQKRLGERVRRILEGPAEGPSARRRWLPAAAAALLLAGAALVPGLAPSSFAVPQGDEPQGAGPAGAGPEGAAPAGGPEGDGAAGATPKGEAPEGDEELRYDLGAEHEYDHEHDFEVDRDHDLDVDHDFDHAYDFDLDHDFDFDFDLPDPGEIAELMAEAMEAQREALEELGELRIEEHLSAEEHAELKAELRAVHQEIARAMAAAQPAFEELERLRLELQGELGEELRRANEELERAHEELQEVDRHLREEMEVELRRAEKEIERANEELRRANEEVREAVQRDLRVERDEVRRELERAREEARRELEIERRELDQQRRELERERQRLREELRERERREEAEEPPGQ